MNLEELNTLLSEIKKLEKEGKVSIKTPCQIESLDNENELKIYYY